MLFIFLQLGILVTFFGSIILIHLIYFKTVFSADTRLRLSSQSQRWNAIDFHLLMFQSVEASLPKEKATNRQFMTLQMTQFDMGFGSQPLAVPSGDINYHTANAVPDFSIASAHDVAFAGQSRFPYVFANDVRITHPDSITGQYLVARQNMYLRSESLEIDALLAGGDIEVDCVRFATNRIAGSSFSINAETMPMIGRKAFELDRSPNAARKSKFLITATSWTGDNVVQDHIVCTKDLSVDGIWIFFGDVKIYGDLQLNGPTIFLGTVIVNGDLHALADCVFMSNVVVKKHFLCEGDVIAGQPLSHPVSVVARDLTLTNSVVGNGLLSCSKRMGISYEI